MVLPVFQRTVVNSNGDVIPSAQITVIDENTGVAPAGGIFSDRAGTVPLGSGGVFSTGADGFAQFYAAKGTYRVTALDLGTALSQTWRYVVLSNSDMYYPDNILGTVSQSGGVPTGAIVQRGDNANGEFVRWADGTQIVLISGLSIDSTEARGNIFRSSLAEQVSITFPVPFLNVNYSPSVVVQSSIRWGLAAIFLTTGMSVGVYGTEPTTGGNVRVSVFGRWY